MFYFFYLSVISYLVRAHGSKRCHCCHRHHRVRRRHRHCYMEFVHITAVVKSLHRRWEAMRAHCVHCILYQQTGHLVTYGAEKTNLYSYILYLHTAYTRYAHMYRINWFMSQLIRSLMTVFSCCVFVFPFSFLMRIHDQISSVYTHA